MIVLFPTSSGTFHVPNRFAENEGRSSTGVEGKRSSLPLRHHDPLARHLRDVPVADRDEAFDEAICHVLMSGGEAEDQLTASHHVVENDVFAEETGFLRDFQTIEREIGIVVAEELAADEMERPKGIGFGDKATESHREKTGHLFRLSDENFCGPDGIRLSSSDHGSKRLVLGRRKSSI